MSLINLIITAHEPATRWTVVLALRQLEIITRASNMMLANGNSGMRDVP